MSFECYSKTKDLLKSDEHRVTDVAISSAKKQIDVVQQTDSAVCRMFSY